MPHPSLWLFYHRKGLYATLSTGPNLDGTIRSRWGQRLGQKKWEVSYWAQKCGKSPDFARNQDFLVAETGLEPATSGL